MLGAYLEPCLEDVAVTSTKNLREVAQGECLAFSLRCMRDFMDTLLYVAHERDVGHIEHSDFQAKRWTLQRASDG